LTAAPALLSFRSLTSSSSCWSQIKDDNLHRTIISKRGEAAEASPLFIYGIINDELYGDDLRISI
ncbi:MAG TPA: hypothetical protein PKC69_16035, partial [Chitinophagaceae bacterium]|nr:hypothetical protein [Chitinophagaceae bacterium]